MMPNRMMMANITIMGDRSSPIPPMRMGGSTDRNGARIGSVTA